MDQYSTNSPLEVDEQQLLGQHRQALRCVELLGPSRVLLASCPKLSQLTPTEHGASQVHLIPNLCISAKTSTRWDLPKSKWNSSTYSLPVLTYIPIWLKIGSFENILEKDFFFFLAALTLVCGLTSSYGVLKLILCSCPHGHRLPNCKWDSRVPHSSPCGQILQTDSKVERKITVAKASR